MGLAFFGLTPEYKKVILDEVFLLCYNSQGGFTHDQVYNMPIRYRQYYLQKLAELIEKQQEEVDKKFNINGSQTGEPSKIPPQGPVQLPDFVTKARAPKK